ncbi:winged helix-turn-helix transcriptional regulator [Actinacidiphila rubida]|uniref:Transcriptional regulator, HxlR family n=1 Tax=Actinacidiphila rubida TaxID=310780 RepID=A0A1H8QNN1_9ACTN|nr:helix-turn-helix domain-containing protein [Actinacidiphila rubida]SEO55577.1 transcriptional regulator, HxlR family [Actinacidiphila rubida]
MAATLELVGDRWSLLALREILFGNHRFTQIARNTGAPRDRLAARLKSLVDDGLLEKREYQVSRSEYHFTEAGRELFKVLLALMTWGDKWAVDDPPLVLEHHGHQVVPVTLCDVCRQEIKAEDLHLVSCAPGWSMSGPEQVEASPAEQAL